MIILGIEARNFMRFVDFKAVDLPSSGLIGIFGDNETGKSTIGELICFSLFGKTTKAPEGEPDRIVGWNDDQAETALEFRLDQREYRIARTLKNDGGSEACMTRVNDGQKIAHGFADVEAAVVELLGYGFMEFRYSTYIAQKELNLIVAGGENRRQALGTMLGISFMERMAAKMATKSERFVEDSKNIESERGRKLAEMEEVKRDQEAYQKLGDQLGEMNDELLVFIRDRNSLQSELTWLTEIREKKEIQEILEIKIERQRAKLKDAEAELKRISQEFDSIPQLKEKIKANEKEILQIKNVRIVEKEGDIKLLEARAKLVEQAKEHLAAVDRKRRELKDAEGRLQNAEKKSSLCESYRERIESTQNFLDSFQDLEALSRQARRLQEERLAILDEQAAAKARLRAKREEALEKESALLKEQELLARQIEKATLTNIDHETILQLQSSENRLNLARNATFILSGFSIMFAIAFPVFGNALTYLFLFGCVGMALSLGGVFLHYRLKISRNSLQNLQQQSYAFNVTQRSRDELVENYEDNAEIVKRLVGEKEALQTKIADIGQLKFASFQECRQSLEILRGESDEESGVLLERLEKLIEISAGMERIYGSDFTFDRIESKKPRELAEERKEQLEEFKLTVSALEGDADLRKAIQEEISRHKTDLKTLGEGLEDLQREIDGIELEQTDAAIIVEQIEKLYLECDRLELENVKRRAEIDRIREQEKAREDILKEREELVGELDRDTIRLYDCQKDTKGVDLSETRFRKLSEELNQKKSLVQEKKTEMARVTGQMKAMDAHIQRGERIRKELEDINRRLYAVQEKIHKYGELRNLFLGAGQDIRKRLVPLIESYFGWALPRLTRGRYQKVRIDENFNIEVYSSEKGGFVALERLSGGAVDQLLISLRLAFSKAVTSNSPFPRQFLFLDEPFSSFDEPRRELFLNFLRSMKTEFQQIFLISHLSNLEDHVDAFMRLNLDKTRQPRIMNWAVPQKGGREEGRANLKLVQ